MKRSRQSGGLSGKIRIMQEDEKKTCSIQLTVQRTRTEYGFVSVLVTTHLLSEDGTLDADKLLVAAAQAAAHTEMTWYAQDESIEIHPMQRVRHEEKILAADVHGDLLDDSKLLGDCVHLTDNGS